MKNSLVLPFSSRVIALVGCVSHRASFKHFVLDQSQLQLSQVLSRFREGLHCGAHQFDSSWQLLMRTALAHRLAQVFLVVCELAWQSSQCGSCL